MICDDTANRLIAAIETLITRYEGCAFESGLDEWTIENALKSSCEILAKAKEEIEK